MKKLIAFVLLGFCIFLTSCKEEKSAYDKNGYTSIVTYDFNGGIMTNSVTDIKDSIKYAFKPESYICDPTTLPNCTIKKEGYRFAGWYRDEELTHPWNFSSSMILYDSITLYAKWETVIHYTYTVAYWDEDKNETVPLYSYEVEEGGQFSDFLNKAKDRQGYTPIGYYKDKECTEAWDFAFDHPGGGSDLDILVYVKYIKGDYTLVSSYNELIGASGNIYLLCDIDCGGKTLNFKEFNKEFNGNGFTISNFKIEPRNVARLKYSIFTSLTEGACIKDITFDSAVLMLPSARKTELRIAGLAGSASGDVSILNVTVCNSKIVIPSGFTIADTAMMTIDTNSAVYDISNARLTVENFTADYIIEDERQEG